MQTVYLWDERSVYFLAKEVDELGELPERSTFTEPPAVGDGQVAVWVGIGWQVQDKPQPPQPAQEPVEQVIARYESAVQAKMDAAANQRGYDSLATAISYADEPAVVRFQADGQAFRRWRSLVWDSAHSTLNAVLAGEEAQPDLETFLAGLPALELPT
ncbi:hypothetical protein ACIPL1_24660 [Pseudomonas sp. NPDC090202]|uniref:hypothetical protein n=1 Tax=Pseudomonas sp. NPDC090202 TaxID=3364476 RepID=UPI003815E4A1